MRAQAAETGYGPALPVHYLGKAATFNLLYAFPFLLLADHQTEMTLTQTFASVSAGPSRSGVRAVLVAGTFM